MKIQSLAVIFIIIIMPITMVLSEYVNNKITSVEVELQYDTRLLDATYDAVKAYQLNTVNNQFGDVTTEKVEDVEAAVNTFFNSLTSSFNYSGYNSSIMEEYVPAVVFTMYDGYYIYSPYTNVLTEVQDSEHSDDYEDGDELDGLKPYVSYSCRYTDYPSNGDDFIITYTLDNYITIQGTINGQYVYDYGYLYSISTNSGNTTNKIYHNTTTNTYTYDGITFSEDDDTEELKEFVGNAEYSYVKINGKKYYLDDNAYSDRTGTVWIDVDGDGTSETEIAASTGIFFIDSDGTKNYSQTKGYSTSNTNNQNDEFLKYYRAIKNNKSAYEYYKNAYEFSVAVLGSTGATNNGYTDKAGTSVGSDASHSNGKYNLSGLKSSDAYIWNNASSDTTSLQEYNGGEVTNIFDDSSVCLQLSTSNFNEHRKTIIRYVIETNLSTAISSFASSAGTSSSFVMPKISEDDWEIIENDVCAITFLQGLSTGASKYNGYAVVANTLTNEYIDENDIYILAINEQNEYVYCKANDKSLLSGGTLSILTPEGKGNSSTRTYKAGVWKLNLEIKQDISNGANTIYYVPLSFYNSSGQQTTYTGTYTSIYGSYNVEALSDSSEDMYTYISTCGNADLKTAYYTALARERWGSYNVNNVNYELYNNSTGVEYFINDY